MSDTTPNLALPLIAAAQAQKHVTHNEALALIDALVQMAVESMALAAPPAMPAEGARYVVAAGATGAWAGKSGQLAIVSGGGFTFQTPRPGFLVYNRATSKLMLFDGTVWRDAAPGGEPPPLPDSTPRLGLNATASDTQRLAVQSRSALFSHDTGGDVQVQVNRQGATNTGSMVYSSGWSGRAETGLAGSDDFTIKVSGDGATWRDAMVAEAATGRVQFPGGIAAATRPAFSASTDIHMSSPGVSAFADFLTTAGRLYVAPVAPSWRRMFATAAIRVTTAAAGLARLALYEDTGDGRPGALIANLGTVDTGTVGLKSLAMARDLDARPYWLGALFQAAPRVMGQQGPVLGVAGSATATTAIPVAGLFRAHAWATPLPANESASIWTPATPATGCPLFYIR